MEITNYTPFVPLFFQSRNPAGVDFGVLVIRGTFSIMPGKALRPHPEQHPIVDADVYWGEAAKSSVKMESDLAPFKPKSDIHLNAVARAPRGEPAEKWLVRVRVGKLEKYLRVTGPRYWQHHRLGGWKLSKPEACLEVPIRYELAFGGVYEKKGESVAYEYNPVGVGLIDPKYAKHKNPISAPQVEDPRNPIAEVGFPYTPQGLGPVARAWLPRRKLAGTFDERWQKERWPNLPEDFDYAHYNSAHADLIYAGYLRGDEQVAVLGLHHDHELAFQLPGYRMAALLRHDDGMMNAAPLVLDTLYFDFSAAEEKEQRAHLIWRGVFPIASPIRVLEARMQQPNHQAKGAAHA
jgi:hypothetical protein